MTNELSLHDMQMQMNQLRERMLRQQESDKSFKHEICDHLDEQARLNEKVVQSIEKLAIKIKTD